MPIKFLRSGTPISAPIKFDFSRYGTVYDYAVGVSSWKFAYMEDHGAVEHAIKDIKIHCNSNLQGTSIVTTVSAVMEDNNGHKAGLDDCTVDLCCAAVVGQGSSGAVGMGNPANGVPDGRDSGPFDLPDAKLSVATAFLSGFDLSYGDTDHNVHSVAATTGLSLQGSRGQITSTANIADATGHSSTGATIDGGYVATREAEGHLLVRTASAPGKPHSEELPDVPVDFGAPIADDAAVGVFITGFSINFDGGKDFPLHQISAGTFGWRLSNDRTVVTLRSPGVYMVDYHDHWAHQSESWVNLTVLAAT